MFCVNCGNQMGEGERFCSQCGFAVQPAGSQANGQPPASQQPYQQSAYGQSTYGQSGYDHPAYGQSAAYGQPPVSQPGYAQQPNNVQPPYAQQPYAQQSNAQPGYTHPPYAQQPNVQPPYAQQSYAQQSNAQQPAANQTPVMLVGFSPRINAPAFAKYKGKSVTWSFLFAAILGVVALVAFPIYGKISGDIAWPQSLYYGMGIGGMFLLIALLQTIKQGRDRTWDGTVAFKDCYNEVTRDRDGHTHQEIVYVLKVRKDTGGVKKHKWHNIAGPYDYYNVGDRVRHHKGFYYYEKYDKSKDAQIMCAACLSFNDIENDVCTRCKCPLLK